jgi:molecular chaperone DnaK
MTREADTHRDEDRKRKEEIEVRNSADSALYSAEKYLRELGDKVPANVRDDVNSKVTALRSALQGKDLPAITKAKDDLAVALQAIGSAMYGQGSAPGASQPPPGGTPGGGEGPGPAGGGSGDVVDGEFKPM